MIVTFTANPSIDRTVALTGPLERGEVQRAASVIEQAAGKGINVARCLQYAEEEVAAVGAFLDEAYRIVAQQMTPPMAMDGVTVDGPYKARVNTAITEPDGTTTKINESGPTLSPAQVDAATRHLVEVARARRAEWVVLSGSLPPGAPDDWYARIVTELRPLGAKVAIDTSDAALDAVLAALPEGRFDLIKPNSDELAQLTGGDAAEFEAQAGSGDVAGIVAAARELQRRGIANVLVTLGGAGAVLVTADGAWSSTAPDVEVRSTVGAGDSAVAGFVLADAAGGDPAACLANAVAYGSAAASLPGTTLPRPSDVNRDDARVTRID